VLAASLGEFVARTGSATSRPDVAAAVRLRILDTLGAGLAGIHLGNHLPLLPLLESSATEATLWGTARRASRREAALLNSFATHSTYLEDGSRFTGGHPSSVVIPAALAEAEAQRCSGVRLVAAVAAGYEIFLRLGRAIYPSTVTRGFQSTAVLGAVSSAAAIASLRNLDAAVCGHALAIAANLGVGLKEALKSSASQPIQVARSCEGGFVAATLAQGGLEGAEAIFEKGFLPAFGGEVNMGSILAGLGSEDRIAETYLKRHAGCRGNHAPLDAVLALRERHSLDARRVKHVRVFVDTVTRAAAIEPPANGKQAQFSIGFSVAVALLDGNASIFQYRDERLSDPVVRALMARISVEVDAALDAGYPERRASRVEIEMDDGRVLREAVDNARGEPEWPLSPREIEEKFLALATPGLGAPVARRIANAIAQLDSLEDVSQLTRLLVPGSAP
jgi:2-methylcitrate dehydratase PrpD